MLFWNTCINDKTESKRKKMINTKVIWYSFLGKKGSVVIGKRFWGGLWGAAVRQSKMWGRTFQKRRQEVQRPVGRTELGTQREHIDVTRM